MPRSLSRFFRVSARSRNITLFLLGPLALQLVLSKLVKYAVLMDRAETSNSRPRGYGFTEVLTEHAPYPLLILVLPVFVVFLLRSRRRLTAGSEAIILVTGWLMGALLAWMFFPGEQLWLNPDFLYVVRADLALLLAMSLGVMLTVERLTTAGMSTFMTVLHAVVLCMMTLVMMDFAYFVSTGSLADSYLLRYVILNTDDLANIILHEMTGVKLVSMLLPVVIIGGSLFYAIRSRPGHSTETFVWTAWTAAALIVLLAPVGRPSANVAMISSATITELFADVLSSARVASAASAGFEVTEPLSDTQSLKLTAEQDSVQLPNIVFLILESHRHHDFLREGVLQTPTPFLDSLARQSAVIERMYAVVPHTNRALVPILCGAYPLISQGDEPDVTGRCLPHLLRDHGYSSAFFTPATLDFERKDQLLSNMGFGRSYGDGDFATDGFSQVNYFGYEERSIIAGSMRWVDEQLAASHRFLAVFLTVTPHHPYTVPEEFSQHMFVQDAPVYNQYLNALYYVDTFARELFGEFADRSLLDDTIFVILGDHGEAFGEHGLRYHSAVPYDNVLRVPAMIYARGRGLPSSVRGLRQQQDLVPTIADLAGLSLTGGFVPGKSVLTPADTSRRIFFAGWIENQSMGLIDGTAKYVYHFERMPMQTFDLSVDPAEQTDLGPPENPEGVLADIQVWRARVNRAYGR